jgi:hypothetical protein
MFYRRGGLQPCADQALKDFLYEVDHELLQKAAAFAGRTWMGLRFQRNKAFGKKTFTGHIV